MSLVAFDALPDHAKLWIFPADRPLQPAEAARMTETVERSLAGWNAHGSEVSWGYTLEQDQVLLIGVDETHTALSGCSIDNAVRKLRDLEKALGIDLLDNSRVFYRDGDRLSWAARPRFRELAEGGAVTADTPVLNNVIATVGEYRGGKWETPARDSWHARAFPLQS